jgi:hypothetical protein
MMAIFMVVVVVSFVTFGFGFTRGEKAGVTSPSGCRVQLRTRTKPTTTTTDEIDEQFKNEVSLEGS